MKLPDQWDYERLSERTENLVCFKRLDQHTKGLMGLPHMGLINPRYFSPFLCSYYFIKDKQLSMLQYLFSDWYNNSCRITANLQYNFKITVVLKVHRMWTVRGLDKEVRKISHLHFRAFGSLQKIVTMTSFSSCSCWASWTRETFLFGLDQLEKLGLHKASFLSGWREHSQI